jgi:tetraacyldisaccharide 4'-kinase
MNLKTIFPQAWAQQSAWLYLLLPFSWLYAAISTLKVLLHQRNILKSYRAPVPVMVIGNITVGGSGKTPLIIELVNFLQQACGLKVGVISRGYGGEGPFPQLVVADSFTQYVGDEPVLIVSATQAAMAVGPNRQQAIELLLQNHHLDIILSDDGLQHLALQRDLEWIVVDIERGFGNQQLLPTGFLREPIQRLETATVIEHGKASQSSLNMHLFASELEPLIKTDQQQKIQSQTVHAVAGIGYPKRFFDSLRQLGFEVIEHEFEDHHAYTPVDLDFDDDLSIITTAKDAVKFKDFANFIEKDIWVLPVQAKLSMACYQLLHQQLTALGLKLPPFEF